MYKTLGKKEWRKLLKVSDDYSVDGFIAVGAGNRYRQIEIRDEILRKLEIKYDIEKIEHRFFSTIDVLVINGKRYWYDVVYGGAYLSEIQALACILGSKINIFIGSCGGLSDRLNSGDIIIPTYTYGNESTTRMYQREVKDNKHYPNEGLSKKVFSMISDKYTKMRGPIITCQAMLGETKEDIEKWEGEGYLGVEMESSTFFAVSNHYKTPSTGIIHVSDNLVKEEYVGSKEYEKGNDYREEIRREKYSVVMKVLLESF